MNTLTKITPEIEKRCILIKLALAISDRIENDDELVVRAINAIEYNSLIYDVAIRWYNNRLVTFHPETDWELFIDLVQHYEYTR